MSASGLLIGGGAALAGLAGLALGVDFALSLPTGAPPGLFAAGAVAAMVIGTAICTLGGAVLTLEDW